MFCDYVKYFHESKLNSMKLGIITEDYFLSLFPLYYFFPPGRQPLKFLLLILLESIFKDIFLGPTFSLPS